MHCFASRRYLGLTGALQSPARAPGVLQSPSEDSERQPVSKTIVTLRMAPSNSVRDGSEVGTPSRQRQSGTSKTFSSCLEAIKSIGAKERAGEASIPTYGEPSGTCAGAESEERETYSSPCKFARLARQLQLSDGSAAEGGGEQTSTTHGKLNSIVWCACLSGEDSEEVVNFL